MASIFALPVFFIVFRETVETSLVVSILLAFLKQQIGPEQDPRTYKKLRNQVATYHLYRQHAADVLARCGWVQAVASRFAS